MRNGCQWNHLPRTLGDDSTIHRTFQRWVELGVLEGIWAVLVEECDKLSGVDWEWQAADCAMGKARWGGAVGRDPTDRGKAGSKRSILVDAGGGPLSVVVAGANVHDTKLLALTLDSIVVERPDSLDRGMQHLCLDKGYDNPTGRQAVAEHGYRGHIRRGYDYRGQVTTISDHRVLWDEPRRSQLDAVPIHSYQVIRGAMRMILGLIAVSMLNALSTFPLVLRARHDLTRQGRLSFPIAIWADSICTFTQRLRSRLHGWTVVRSTKPLLISVGIGLVIASIGAGLIVAGRREYASRARVYGLLEDKLITKGIYRNLRNPQYAGYWLMMLGAVMASLSQWALLLASIFALIVHFYVKVSRSLTSAPHSEKTISNTAIGHLGTFDSKANSYGMFRISNTDGSNPGLIQLACAPALVPPPTLIVVLR